MRQEEELGTVLFYRNSRVMKLTEQGEKFYFELKNLYENQQLDLVISTCGLSEHGNFKKIFTYESCAVMTATHPLANEKVLRMDEYCLTQRNTIFVHFTFMPS